MLQISFDFQLCLKTKLYLYQIIKFSFSIKYKPKTYPLNNTFTSYQNKTNYNSYIIKNNQKCSSKKIQIHVIEIKY